MSDDPDIGFFPREAFTKILNFKTSKTKQRISQAEYNCIVQEVMTACCLNSREQAVEYIKDNFGETLLW
jgi:hypothetical protein